MMNHRLPTLDYSNQTPVEFLPDIAFREIEAAVALLERGGYIPVLAYVERYQCFYLRKFHCGLVDFAAPDAHDCDRRPFRMRKECILCIGTVVRAT